MRARYALVGAPIDRSPSPAMHNAAFASLALDAEYVLRPAGPAEVPAVWRELGLGRWQGLNVTTPLKLAFATHLSLDAEAARAGAVNTVYYRDGWRGALTDVAGVEEPLSAAGVRAQAGRVALVLGAGGAARAAVLALEALGCEVHLAARQVAQASRLLAELAPRRAGLALALDDQGALGGLLRAAGVVVQATPVGRAGDHLVLPWARAQPGLVAFDMVYLPRLTPFLTEAAARGAVVIEGWQMLLAQAAHSFRLWTGQEAPRSVMQTALAAALAAASGRA